MKQELLNSALTFLSAETLGHLPESWQEFINRLSNEKLEILVEMLQAAAAGGSDDCTEVLAELIDAVEAGLTHKTKAVQEFASQALEIINTPVDDDEAVDAIEWDTFDEDDYVPES